MLLQPTESPCRCHAECESKNYVMGFQSLEGRPLPEEIETI